MVEFAISSYTSMLEFALPVAVVFGFCDLIVSTFMRVAFGGRLWLGK